MKASTNCIQAPRVDVSEEFRIDRDHKSSEKHFYNFEASKKTHSRLKINTF